MEFNAMWMNGENERNGMAEKNNQKYHRYFRLLFLFISALKQDKNIHNYANDEKYYYRIQLIKGIFSWAEE